MIKGRILPDTVIDSWPEVFGEVTLNVLPLPYVEAVLILFKDGKMWEMGISRKNNKKKLQEFHKGLTEILATYEDYIEEIDVKINTDKVKRDVEKSIKKMFNKLGLQ
jgi:hypothetical protein